MMDPKIIVTSPHPQFTELAREISKSEGIEIIIIEAILEHAAQLVAEICAKRDIVVILSRGGTALAIQNRVDVPVISIETNDFDILLALWEARRHSHAIAYLSYAYESPPYEFDSLFEIIGIKIRQYTFMDRADMERQIGLARDAGIEVIVSGSLESMDLAEAAGLRGVLVKTGQRTMHEVLSRAAQVVEMRENDLQKSLQMETMLSLSRDGIIILDKTGRVSLINPTAKSLLGQNSRAVVGVPLGDTVHNQDLSRLIDDPGEATEKVISIDGRHVIVNKSAIIADRHYYGQVMTLQEAAKIERLEHSVRRQLHSKGLIARTFFDDIIGNSATMLACIERAAKFALTDGTVLISGESGTGKEMFAQSIHNHSRRRINPFVAVNCAALPEGLLESELFGYEEGAFTGARKGGKPGLFELAHKGTLFLDELSSIPLKVQVQLLRVLQERQVFRIGGDKVIPVDVRIIGATNENLAEVVKAGKFRFDLYYRLNVLNVEIPPLRDRPEDIPLLVRHFLMGFAVSHHKEIEGVSPALMRDLSANAWPGNVRELMNCIERMVIISEGPVLDGAVFAGTAAGGSVFSGISFGSPGGQSPARHSATMAASVSPTTSTFPPESGDRGTLQSWEARAIMECYERCAGNRTHMAREIGMCRTTIWKKLKQLGVSDA